jgi:RsiW-degrading membrane proteinase PrsW (M82 family)
VLVTVTFYLRARIGMRSFRLIHYLSLIGYLGATLHGLYAGTDSPLPAMHILYDVTGLVVLFLTVYWLAMIWLKKQEAQREAARARLMRHHPRVVR